MGDTFGKKRRLKDNGSAHIVIKIGSYSVMMTRVDHLPCVAHKSSLVCVRKEMHILTILSMIQDGSVSPYKLHVPMLALSGIQEDSLGVPAI
jgi:hypothetical protein